MLLCDYGNIMKPLRTSVSSSRKWGNHSGFVGTTQGDDTCKVFRTVPGAKCALWLLDVSIETRRGDTEARPESTQGWRPSPAGLPAPKATRLSESHKLTCGCQRCPRLCSLRKASPYMLLVAPQGSLLPPLSWLHSSLGQGRGPVSCACNWQ